MKYIEVRYKCTCKLCGVGFESWDAPKDICSENCPVLTIRDARTPKWLVDLNAQIQQKKKLNAKKFLNVNEVCKIFGVSRSTVTRLLNREGARTVKAGRNTIIKRLDAEKIFAPVVHQKIESKQ